MKKEDLRKLMRNDKIKTTLELLYSITEKDADLQKAVIVNTATYNSFIKLSFIRDVSQNDWNTIRDRILGIIEELPDEDFQTELPTTEAKVEKDFNLGKIGISRFGVVKILIPIVAIMLMLLIYFFLDRKAFAFDYLFSDISKNNSQKNFQSFDYKGDWFLEEPYIIRKDTIQGDAEVYYTVGESAKAYFYCVDALNLGGIEYITNMIYSVGVMDTAKIKAFKDLDSIGKKIQKLNIVFREEINIDEKKTDAERRTGNIMGRYSPDSRLAYFFSQRKHKKIVEKIINKYESASKRKCVVKIDKDDTNKKKFICTCATIEKNPSKYVKILKQK